ncbi:ankyrin repeat domain-containing protein EMB506, chloroplastic-like [Salvia splendens]|uniref:ankyrin repeat domain-containing protein EMB506, chloroplastic-like n=1 Tax=Salvia splendens TaxID=180675 RepID=UPI001C255A97|nr:ankyrin repeat domain-containing protein EMB506, chloroplastic-like [Salvia splendens]XP_042039839.1 ankyrin repeat domain-containing protein EMB506, chloroplastic-like [Salvia splendens]
MSSSAIWTSTVQQNPQNLPLLFPLLPVSPLSQSRTIQFHRPTHNHALKHLHSSFQPLYDDEPAIGDCLVYEEGIFHDTIIETTTNSRRSATTSTANKDADVAAENLIPDEWLDVQKELNITKKGRRKMAQELEYGTRVMKRRQALMPLDSEGQDKIEQARLDKFEKIKQEKIKQLSPVLLDNPKKEYFREIGLTAIHKAILAKKQAIFNFLLRESANPFVRDNEGATLLHYAVFAASSQMIKILLLYNVDINLQDNDGWTPLHLAVQSCRTDILRLLLLKGADKSLKNKDGLTALDLCLYSGRDARTYELIKLLKRIY